MSECNRASTPKEIKSESDEIFIPVPEDLGPGTWRERCIYRVPPGLRRVNPSAYTPNLVSIGPLHHGNKRFQAMEKEKLRYLHHFCQRTGKTSSELAVPIKKKEATIRRCYDEASMLCSKNFIRMIMLDAVFIIELFLKTYNEEEEKDCMLSKPWIANDLLRDIIILENQLPWFILEDLFYFSFPNAKNSDKFIVLTVCFVEFTWKRCDPSNQKQNKLVGYCGFSLRHGNWIKRICPRSRKIGKDQSGAETNKMSPEEISGLSTIEELVVAHEENPILHIVDVVRKGMTSGLGSPEHSEMGITKLYNATKLRGAGVKFMLSSRKSPKLEITFKEGVLSMAEFYVGDMSECIYRNVMAFEQCHPLDHGYVCDYIDFIDYLIDSENDVDLLVQNGVIVNFMGESRAVSRMVNKLCKETLFSGSIYYDLSEELNAHVDNWWNRSVATLKSVYFANLWRGTATVTAFVLVVLTFIQTYCAVKQLLSFQG